MADSAIFDLTPETVLTAAHEFVTQDTSAATRAQAATFALMGGLEVSTGSDANTTMAVGTLYRVDMSAWATADRTYTLPASAQVGERIGISVTAGNASFELIVTAAASDTLNGVAGGTEWSRLFITNELVIMRCVAANSTWVVEYDGRIPCSAFVARTNTSTGSAPGASTWGVVPFGGDGTTSVARNVGSILVNASDRMTFRRDGIYHCAGSWTSASALADGDTLACSLGSNASTFLAHGPIFKLGASIAGRAHVSALLDIVVATSANVSLLRFSTTNSEVAGSNNNSWFAAGEIL